MTEPLAQPYGERFDLLTPVGSSGGGREERGWLERLDPRVKLVAVLCASVLAVTLDHLGTLLGLTLLCGLPLVLSGRPQTWLRPILVLLLLATWGTVLSQGLFYELRPRTPLLTLLPEWRLGRWQVGGLRLYQEGLKHGLIQSLRFDALILLGAAVTSSTPTERLFLGLVRLKIPYGLAFMAVTAVRFLPLMLEELRMVLAVRQLRGYRPGRGGLRLTLRTELGTLKPVLMKGLRRATDLSAALGLRAFDPQAERSSFRELRLGRGEWVVMMGLVGLTGVAAVLRILFALYLRGAVYVSPLRGVYAWVRDWL